MKQGKGSKPDRLSRSTNPPPARNSPSSPRNEATTDGRPAGGASPRVGIGSSAGGLEALENFFTQVPRVSGMDFILVSHVDPDHASILAELVPRFTPMPLKVQTELLPVLTRLPAGNTGEGSP